MTSLSCWEWLGAGLAVTCLALFIGVMWLGSAVACDRMNWELD